MTGDELTAVLKNLYDMIDHELEKNEVEVDALCVGIRAKAEGELSQAESCTIEGHSFDVFQAVLGLFKKLINSLDSPEKLLLVSDSFREAILKRTTEVVGDMGIELPARPQLSNIRVIELDDPDKIDKVIDALGGLVDPIDKKKLH